MNHKKIRAVAIWLASVMMGAWIGISALHPCWLQSVLSPAGCLITSALLYHLLGMQVERFNREFRS